MTTWLLTGATGTVGSAIARRLAAREEHVRALVRNSERARTLLPPGIELVPGDVTDAESVARAMPGVDNVVHSAGIPEQWQRDPSIFERVNTGGTRTMVEAALRQGVQCFLHTSTIDVFAYTPGVEFDERSVDPVSHATAYERSKQAADRLVTEAVQRGLPARIVHPAAVYGVAPVTTPGVNWLIQRLARGRIPLLLDGGMPMVFSDDVAEGHLLVAAAPVGSRYILCESYAPLVEVARVVVELRGRGRVPRVMPRAGARATAAVGEVVARVTHRAPLVAQGELHFVTAHLLPSSRRIREELGWRPLPLREGMQRTLDDMARRGVI